MVHLFCLQAAESTWFHSLGPSSSQGTLDIVAPLRKVMRRRSC